MASYPEQRASETTKAYDAFVSYCALGTGRTCEQVADKYQKSVSLIYRWCREHAWQERIKEWDQSLAEEAAAQHSARYLADLEAHRKKASDAGAALYAVAALLIKQVNHALTQPKYITGEDGKRYQLHGVDFTATTFAIAARAMQTALDLDAHSLGVDRILGETQE